MRRLLIIAFALSLLVHLIVATRVQWPFAGPSREETGVIHIAHLTRIARVAAVPSPHPQTPPPHTPPPRTPPPQTPAPVARPAHRASAPRAPRIAASGTTPAGTGGGTGSAGGPPSATPFVEAIPSIAPCKNSDTPALLAASPPPPDLPPQARADAVSGVVRIRVALDADGHVAGTTIVGSSGSGSLDLAAVGMARAAQYAPAQHDCKAVASTYVFSVKFVSW